VKNLRIFLLLSILVLVAYKELLLPGLPYTHDSQNHVARMANYYLALKQGHFPPRMAPNLNNSFGYPVFNFNYPLANIVAVPFIVADVPLVTAYKLITLITLLLSLGGMYVLTKTFMGSYGAITAAFLYTVNPYQANLVFVRGVIGESLAMALLPWIIWSLGRFVNNGWNKKNYVVFVLLLSAFFLSHNILVLLSVPVLLLALGVTLYRTKKFEPLWAFAHSLLIVLFFWLPALAEKGMTVLDEVAVNREFIYHFPRLGQLLFSQFAFGFSRIGPVDGMSFNIGLPLTVGLLVIPAIILKTRSYLICFLGLGLIGIIFLMLEISEPLWRFIPFVSYAQFPWRWLFIATGLAAILSGITVTHLRWGKLLSVFLILYSLYLAQPSYRAVDRFSYADDYWFTFAQTTSILDENMPKGFDKTAAYALFSGNVQEPVIAKEPISTTISLWTGTKRRYLVESPTDTMITEKGIYFPGWEVTVDGKKVDSQANELGLISFLVPAGSHEVISRITQNTPARIAGNSLSLVGMFILLGSIVYERNRHQKT